VEIKTKKLSGVNKFFGLMFVDSMEPIYFETRLGIHTFFVKKPIDVILMDREFVVQKLALGLKPFRLLFWNPRYFRIIEGQSGLIQKHKIKIGDKIRLK